LKRQRLEFNPLFNASQETAVEQRGARCDQWGTPAIVLQLKSTTQYLRTPYLPSFANVLEATCCMKAAVIYEAGPYVVDTR
jgi:hypothetical protein